MVGELVQAMEIANSICLTPSFVLYYIENKTQVNIMESNHKPILLAMVLGLVVGIVVNLAGFNLGFVGESLVQLNTFIGDLFLRGLRFVAAPIVELLIKTLA